MKLHKKILRATKAETKQLDLSCPVTFDQESLKASAEGQPPKTPKFSMRANTGVPMRVGNFDDPLIVRLTGAKFGRDKTPIIMDHDVKARIGHTTQQDIDLKVFNVDVAGDVSSTTQKAKEFVADAKNGFPFQASISGPIHDMDHVPAGKSMKVNGKVWNGPLNVVNSMTIREISVTVLGADGNTETRVAASQGNPMNPELKAFIESLGLDASEVAGDQLTKLTAAFTKQQTLEANQLPEPKKVKKNAKKKVAAGGVDGDDDTGDDDGSDIDVKAQAREEAALEAERVDSITDLSASYDERINDEHEFTTADGKKVTGLKKFKAFAIRSNMTPDQFELRLMRSSRANNTNQPGAIIKNNDMDSDVLAARLCRDFGLQSGKDRWVANCGGDPRKMGPIPTNMQGREFGLEAYFKADVLEKSHDKKYTGLDSIQALLDLQIRATGKAYHSFDRKSTDLLAQAVDAYNVVRASGFSTLNIPNILENIMHKFALSAFDSQDQTWRAIAGKKNLTDFRPLNMYRLNWQGHFRQVDQQGQLKHISMVDSKYTVQADTYGAMVTVDRKTIRNDDLGQIIQKAAAIGMLGAMRIEESVYTLLLSNPGAFFSATLGNLITGSTSAINQTGASTPATPAGLDQARRAFRNQVINGYPIGLSPRILLGGTSMETQMYQIWAQETFAVAGVSGSINWLLNKNEFQGMYRPVVTPWLNNTSLTDANGNAISGQSSTQWFLFCDPNLPQGSALVIGFLDGRDQPFFDQADTQFNVPGGIQFRSYLDWGVAMNVYQMALKSAGA